MGHIARCGTTSQSVPEGRFELIFPVLDIDSDLQAKEGTVIDCTAQLSIQIEYSAKIPVVAIDANKKPGELEQDNKGCVSDHVHVNKLCVLMGCKKGKKRGCKECCESQIHQPQSVESIDDGDGLLSRKIHEATLDNDWHSVEFPKSNGIVNTETDTTNAHQKQLKMCGEENFELVDGIVKTHLVGGRLVQEWQDTMQMVDSGSQGSSEALKELWLGD